MTKLQQLRMCSRLYGYVNVVCTNLNTSEQKMALPSKAVSSLSLGQRLWNALSAWTIKASGYQKLGKFNL